MPDPQCAWTALDCYRLLFVNGPDAKKFLQGQLTCDLNDAKGDSIISGAHCNPKGRMQCNFVLLALNESCYVLRLHSSLFDQAFQDLKKYSVFSKVELIPDDAHLIVGICGQELNELISAANFQTPEAQKFIQTDAGIVLRHDGNQCELWIKLGCIPNLAETLNNFKQVSEDQWTLSNIRRGIVDIRKEHYAKLLPQEINMQITGGVSFNKGCYIGQEIVARMHYKATLKKHMYRAWLQRDSAPAIFEPLLENGKKVGSVIEVAPASDSRFELLVLCQDSESSTQNLYFESDNSVILQWLPLPYAIPG